MMLPDDSSLTPEEYRKVRKEAERALKEADVYGIFPTPIEAIMRAANVEEVPDDVLNPSFVNKHAKKLT